MKAGDSVLDQNGLNRIIITKIDYSKNQISIRIRKDKLIPVDNPISTAERVPRSIGVSSFALSTTSLAETPSKYCAKKGAIPL